MGMTPETAEELRQEGAGLGSRKLAVSLLKAVIYRRQSFDEAFAACSSKSNDLPSRDRAFAYAIAATALRRLGQIEDLLGRFLGKPLPADSIEARMILVAGVAQLAFMGVAPHAVIGLGVEQAKRSRASHRFGGLVNAVLRKISANAKTIIAGQDAARLNTPDWLFDRWAARFGDNSARMIAAAHLEEPALDLSVKSGADFWAKRLSGALMPWGTVRIRAKGRIEALDGYAEGEWWVQDAAAALPALLLGDVRDKRVADLCAAPGGKTAQLAARGAKVTALDISLPRLRLLEENLKRLGLRAEIVHANASQWTPPAPFDAVLIDAPCSATGTIRRNPDIPYVKTEGDVANLAKTQSLLLSQAVSLVKPGGLIVYATCSLEREEGEAQIERLLAARTEVTAVPIQASELEFPPEAVTEGGMLRTLPFHGGGMDGFFAAKLMVGRA
jgi:16S rRNA (cytosine967-C5)-methyltransferase